MHKPFDVLRREESRRRVVEVKAGTCHVGLSRKGSPYLPSEAEGEVVTTIKHNVALRENAHTSLNIDQGTELDGSMVTTDALEKAGQLRSRTYACSMSGILDSSTGALKTRGHPMAS